MTKKAAAIVASVVAVAAGLFYLNGSVPDSPPAAHRVCARVQVQLTCAAAKQIARQGADINCVDGEVALWVEVVGDDRLTDPLDLTQYLDDDTIALVQKHVDVLEHTASTFDCAQAKRPGKVITPLKLAELSAADTCIAGCVVKDTSEAKDGSSVRTWSTPHICCGDRCSCVDAGKCVQVPPHALAGRSTAMARLIEQNGEGYVCP